MTIRPTGRAGTLLPLGWWRDTSMMGLSPAARDLFVRGLGWSADEKTDGNLPASIAAMLAFQNPEAIAELVDAGQWTETSGGFHAREWATYNLSAADIAARHEARIAAGRAGGQKTAEVVRPIRGEDGKIRGWVPRTAATTEANAAVPTAATTEANAAVTTAATAGGPTVARLPSSVSRSSVRIGQENTQSSVSARDGSIGSGDGVRQTDPMSEGSEPIRPTRAAPVGRSDPGEETANSWCFFPRAHKREHDLSAKPFRCSICAPRLGQVAS
jgi:hypothetical protein